MRITTLTAAETAWWMMFKKLRFFAVLRRHIAGYKAVINQYGITLDACTQKIETLEADLKEANATIAHLTTENNRLKAANRASINSSAAG